MANEFEDLLRRIPEIERRVRNIVRYGIVQDVDPAKGLVKMIDDGGGEGQTYTSDWRPWVEMGGATKTWRPPSKGQPVVMISPSGNLADGIVIAGGFSDQAANKQPSDKGDENVETLGDTRITVKGDQTIITSPRIDLNPGSGGGGGSGGAAATSGAAGTSSGGGIWV